MSAHICKKLCAFKHLENYPKGRRYGSVLPPDEKKRLCFMLYVRDTKSYVRDNKSYIRHIVFYTSITMQSSSITSHLLKIDIKCMIVVHVN